MSATFMAGVAEGLLEITPDIVDNSIHSCMTVRFDEAGSPLRVKALAFSCGDTEALLVALDVCSLSGEHCAALRRAVSAQTGVGFDGIVISCTHSHSTPMAEPLEGPHPFFDLIARQAVAAALEAMRSRRPARVGHDVLHVVGASFNTRVPLPDGGVKFTRDFREGLASGRLVDPRLNVLRVDDEAGRPIAAWVRFAAHPACVIFNAPVSAEYPGYMTDLLSEEVAEGAPVLFGYGASGDVDCVPMFGAEDDSRRLGHQLASLAAPVLAGMETHVPRRFGMGRRTFELPLDAVPSVEQLDREIAEITAFMEGLDDNPEAEWVLGINCKRDWPVEKKRGHVRPLLEWARRVREAIEAGVNFPATWPCEITAWVVDDLGLVFYPGEPFSELGLALAARSHLSEALLVAMSNGSQGYLGTAEDWRRGGYETHTSVRYSMLRPGHRPLPYAPEAGECLLRNGVELLDEICAEPSNSA